MLTAEQNTFKFDHHSLHVFLSYITNKISQNFQEMLSFGEIKFFSGFFLSPFKEI